VKIRDSPGTELRRRVIIAGPRRSSGRADDLKVAGRVLSLHGKRKHASRTRERLYALWGEGFSPGQEGGNGSSVGLGPRPGGPGEREEIFAGGASFPERRRLLPKRTGEGPAFESRPVVIVIVKRLAVTVGEKRANVLTASISGRGAYCTHAEKGDGEKFVRTEPFSRGPGEAQSSRHSGEEKNILPLIEKRP